MEKKLLKSRVRNDSIVLQSARRMALRCRRSIQMPSLDDKSTETVDFEELLVDIYLFILINFGWGKNPLSHLRKYFSEFTWKFKACTNPYDPHNFLAEDAIFVWIVDGGVITVHNLPFELGCRRVISERKPAYGKGWRETQGFQHALIGNVFISTWTKDLLC